MKNSTYFRIIVTYSGFDERKDTRIIRSAAKHPSQTSYSPVEARRSLDFVFSSRRSATSARVRLVTLQQEIKEFSVSKVINDNF